MQHNLYIKENILAAQINIDGEWIDTEKRKLTLLPEIFQNGFSVIPKSEKFEWI